MSKSDVGKSSVARIMANHPSSECWEKSVGSGNIAPVNLGKFSRFFAVLSK